MRTCFTLLFILSGLCFAQRDTIEIQYDYATFKSTEILLADTGVDGYRFIPYNTVLEKIVVCYMFSGDSDSTVIDVQRLDRDTSRTILGAGYYPVVYGGDNRTCNEYTFDKLIELDEGDRIRMDISRVALGNPKNFTVMLYFRKGVPRRWD